MYVENQIIAQNNTEFDTWARLIRFDVLGGGCLTAFGDLLKWVFLRL